MSGATEQNQEPGSFDEQFAQHLFDQIHTRFSISTEYRRDLLARIQDKVPRPKPSELTTPIQRERLERENASLLTAFRQALSAVPKSSFTEPMPEWYPDGAIPDGATLDGVTRSLIKQMESRLGESQLGQVHGGTLQFFDPKMQQGQTVPYNWHGLRFRLLAAAEGDVSPRGHLNYFCNFVARLLDFMANRGFHKAELLLLAENVIRRVRNDLQAQRQAYAASRFQSAFHELTDSLRNIQELVGEILENVNTTLNVKRDQSIEQPLQNVQEKNRVAAETLKHVEEVGLPMPPGLRDRMRKIIQQAKEMGGAGPNMDSPEEMARFASRIRDIRKQSQAMSGEFRRIRRKSIILLRQTAARFGRQLEALRPKRLRDQTFDETVEAAKELIWTLQDLSYSMELQDVTGVPELMRLKAGLLDRRPIDSAINDVERAINASEQNLARFRQTGRKLLQIAFNLLQHTSQELINQHEGEGVWVTVADSSEAYERFSMVMEGEERLRLLEAPQVLSDLNQALGRADPNRVLPVGVTAALDREQQHARGEIRMSVQQRLDALNVPLKDLLKASLEQRTPGEELRRQQVRAMAVLGVTQEVEKERGRNYLAEITVVPMGQMLEPQDPTYGRSRSELERRLLHGPVDGVLPRAVLFGARMVGSLDDLGSAVVAREREERVRAIVNRSGLVGEVLGVHPLWRSILESDAVRLLLDEMRPLFASNAGEGFLSRIANNNEEYLDYDRVDDAERQAEARLLLNALCDAKAMEDFSATLTATACLLADAALADAIRRESRLFLNQQRDLFATLAIDNPSEHLRPASTWQGEEQAKPFWELLDALPEPKRELCLLQLYHRTLLPVDCLLSLVQSRYEENAWQGGLPRLAAELRERYKWLVRFGNNPSERIITRQLLVNLGLESAVESIDQGLPELNIVREKFERLRFLRQEKDVGGISRLTAMLRSIGHSAPKLEAEIRADFKRLLWLGFTREVHLFERDLAALGRERV